MQDPYNYPFIQKDNTMYLSTISILFFLLKKIKKLKMISLIDQIILDNHLFKKKIYKELHLKY